MQASPLIVTQGGKPLPDQALGVRLFKDACSPKEHYRVVRGRNRASAWRLFHCGREVTNVPREVLHVAWMYDSPGPILEWLRRYRQQNGLTS